MLRCPPLDRIACCNENSIGQYLLRVWLTDSLRTIYKDSTIIKNVMKFKVFIKMFLVDFDVSSWCCHVKCRSWPRGLCLRLEAAPPKVFICFRVKDVSFRD